MHTLVRTFIPALTLAVAALINTAHAQSPKQLELVYRFTLNGQYLGTVTDTFKRDGSRYQLTSVAKPEGGLSMLLPTLTLSSEGDIQSHQFRPARFKQSRSNSTEKTAIAEFDWPHANLSHSYKTKQQSLPLPANTLDALTQLYSFTQMRSLPEQLELPVTNGRKLMTYRYAKQAPERIEAALGSFETIEYRRLTSLDENAISVWIAPSLNNLPLRVRVQENNGLFEQQLMQINFK